MPKAPADFRRTLLVLVAVTSALGPGCSDDGGTEPPDAAQDTAGGDTGTSGLTLTPDLCDDASNLERLGSSVGLDSPSYGTINPEQVQRMLASPTEGPFYMVNLIRFRERAQYADGRVTELTGEEANSLYSPTEFLTAIGARVVFVGDVRDVIIGAEGEWDQVAIVEYPCPLALFAMSADPEFEARAVHKDAGVEASIVMVSKLQESPLPPGFTVPDSPYPSTDDDPTFEIIHVLNYRDMAMYLPDANEPPRTGREAMELYSSGAAEAAERIGVVPTAWFDVEGVLIGDSRPWDEVRLNRMPSRAGFDALVADPTRLDGQHHRNAALEDTYTLATYPTLSMIPGAPENSGPGTNAPPITADGTGTPCLADTDCPGNGVERCLNPNGTGGFCTREGCATGECEAPYLCCGGCAPAVASVLPFEGSACIPQDGAQMLTMAPASCTCD